MAGLELEFDWNEQTRIDEILAIENSHLVHRGKNILLLYHPEEAVLQRGEGILAMLPEGVRLIAASATDGTGHSIPVEIIAGPAQFELLQNYPNPFNQSTTICFRLPRQEQIRLIVYDLMGREVKRLAAGDFRPGQYQFQWDGRNAAGKAVASGIYLYQLQSPDRQILKKMMLLK